MTTAPVSGDEAIDRAAIRAFTEEFGDRATRLPPVAIVIAAFNEEGAIGPVVESLPVTVAGLGAVTIVVSDGSVDATIKEAGRPARWSATCPSTGGRARRCGSATGSPGRAARATS